MALVISAVLISDSTDSEPSLKFACGAYTAHGKIAAKAGIALL